MVVLQPLKSCQEGDANRFVHRHAIRTISSCSFHPEMRSNVRLPCRHVLRDTRKENKKKNQSGNTERRAEVLCSKIAEDG